MTGRRALMVLSLLCALVFTAFTAASASAATTGTTAVTCRDTSGDPTPNTGDYVDEHCDTTAAVLGQGRYKHETIAQDVETAITGTNAKTKSSTTASTPAVLLATVGGVNVEISCTTVHMVGTLKNSLVGEEHKITTTGVVITYTGCTVVNPAGCTVNSPGKPVGEGVTNSLKAESVEGTPMTKKFVPTSGTEFIKLEIKGCAIAGTYAVTGSVSAEGTSTMAAGGGRGPSTGATLGVNIKKEASSTLIVAGQKAGLTQELTTQMDDVNHRAIATTGPPYF